MPVPGKKKRIIVAPDAASVAASPPLLAGQQEFHHYLRTLAQSAVRTVIEAVMREELEAFIGAAWGECSLRRKGYRNGHYTRDLVTSTGRLEDIKVPRDREGRFHDHFDGLRGGPGRQQRGAGIASLRRGKQGGMAQPLARPPHARSHPD